MQQNGQVPVGTMLRMRYHEFHESEKKVADFVMGPRCHELLTAPVVTAAALMGVSEATVIRFCKKIGLSGYSQLKLIIAREAGAHEVSGQEEMPDHMIDRKSRVEDLPQKMIFNAINGLKDTLAVVDVEMLKKAVSAITSARRIALFGVANSAVVCEDIHCKLMRLGFVCDVYSDAHQQLTAAVHMKPGDVAIGISHSGQTKDVVNAVRLAGEKGAETICISNYTHSPLTEVSNIHLLTGGHEASFMSETMVSHISQLAIIDMLYVGIILSDYDAYSAGLSYVNEQVRDKAYEKPY